MDQAEREAEIYRIKKTQGIFRDRRHILVNIPNFWYIILAENDDFSDYISVEDLKYLEYIADIYVHYKVTDGDADLKNPKDFSISITFKSDKELVPNQTVTKHFEVEVEDGEEKITSEPVEVQWPQELGTINPHLIKQRKGKDMSKEDKKNYRLGMKSFFSWFSWTGKKPGKEFRDGEDLTRLITDDLFPYAVKYYTEALPGADNDDADTSDPEELDLEDDEEEEEEEEEEDEDSKRKPEDQLGADSKRQK
ncbi:hypothetical protein CANTEDRAFT_114508 [Yamadazyma tenuis ATCC 10573]|nr:uncharacterized protein CANTEDRAFT_114508 [Yamadazyma tenuis ATCC 10573]EGV63580.1 hypothetical protein CANTEDRAFT_114508 [Yamadazyma tenuis ATCC 10573]